MAAPLIGKLIATCPGITLDNGCGMTKNAPKEIELHPDAWERFERAVGAVAKAPPQHRHAKKMTATKKRAKKKAPQKRG